MDGIDEIPAITSFTGEITYISQNIIHLPVYIDIPHLCQPPKSQKDEKLEEFL